MKRVSVCVIFMLLALSGRADSLWVYRDVLESRWDDWSWSSTRNFAVSSPVYAGAASLSVQTDEWGAFSLYHNEISVAEYGVLEFYIRGSEAGQQLWFYANGNSGSSDTILLNSTDYIEGGTISDAEWKLVQIRLRDVSNMPDSITRINLYNQSASAAPVYYLDEMRLTDASAFPPVLASVHSAGESVVEVNFDQAMDPDSLNTGVYSLFSSGDSAYDPAVDGIFQSQDIGGFSAYVSFSSPFLAGVQYDLAVSGVSNSAGVALEGEQSSSFSLEAVAITIDAGSEVHPISPYIYGVSFGPDSDYLRNAGITVNRWGGNARSKYNWTTGASNTGNDWYFENMNVHNRTGGTPRNFIGYNSAAGCSTLMIVPMLDWVAKDTSSYSYPVAKYGAQDGTDPYKPDAGNGEQGGVLLTADPTDAYIPNRSTKRAGDLDGTIYQDEWLQSLKGTYGDMVSDAVMFISMDNEADIWSSTHRDAHPDAVTYDEMYSKFVEYASMVRSNWSNARITGPVSTGWWFFWNSSAGVDDKAAHGDQDFLPWFLDQVKTHDEAAGYRTLDVLDIHLYPTGIFNDDVDDATRARRLRSSRLFWDPTYQDEGWIGSDMWATQTQTNRNCITLIPRFKQLIDAHYPGTKLGLTEYNMGGEDDISGGLALADVLGIFGREDLYLANHWVGPDADSCAYQAFKLYGNYDGSGSRFGPLSISTISSDQDELSAYASVSLAGDQLTLICVNKNPDQDIVGAITLDTFVPNSTAQVYQVSSAHPDELRYKGSIANASSSFSYTFPAYSATLLVFSGGGSDSDGDGLSDVWELAYSVSDPNNDDDADGVLNIDEYRAGTDPTDPSSCFKVRMHLGAETNVVGFTSVPGQEYQFGVSANLTGGWSNSSAVQGNSSLLYWESPATNHTQFYKAEMVR